ncbi:regulator of Vps4 activity in the MVB pathway-domain-containing protein [Umbelopsis sp. AD052]|nr:regulator of Vps4 activity in the MVB pathway-domain-containing protein [Umbelopsis sp. AD052]
MVFNPPRLKLLLKLASNRLKMLQAKKTSLNQHQRREIAGLLEKGKEDSARIRVEHIIREDFETEAMEILELYCDLLSARFGILEQIKDCDPSIETAVCSVIWAAPRTDQVKELAPIRDQLGAKYGKEFLLAAMENTNNVVNERLVSKLSIATPEAFLVERYLEEIAKAYSVDWRSPDSYGGSDDGGDEDVFEDAKESGQKAQSDDAEQQEDDNDFSESNWDLPAPPSNVPGKAGSKSSPPPPKTDQIPDFDELTRRFEALKRK